MCDRFTSAGKTDIRSQTDADSAQESAISAEASIETNDIPSRSQMISASLEPLQHASDLDGRRRQYSFGVATDAAECSAQIQRRLLASENALHSLGVEMVQPVLVCPDSSNLAQAITPRLHETSAP